MQHPLYSWFTMAKRARARRVRHGSHNSPGICLRSSALAVLVGGALLGSGCATTQPVFNQMLSDVRSLNAALMARLKRLEGTGLEVRSEDNRVTIVVPDVFFEFGQSTLSSDARAAIGEAAQMLSGPDYRTHTIRIEGFTDSVGSEAFNRALSKKRAVAVEQELVFSSVSQARIGAVEGLGEANPVAPNTLQNGDDNPDGRARNRRVEIVIRDPRLTVSK